MTSGRGLFDKVLECSSGFRHFVATMAYCDRDMLEDFLRWLIYDGDTDKIEKWTTEQFEAEWWTWNS